MPDPAPTAQPAGIDLPHSFGAALLRGARCRCPRCGEARLFRRWLKPYDTCPACTLDISGQRADDFPAYISIFVTGHLLAPVLIVLASDLRCRARRSSRSSCRWRWPSCCSRCNPRRAQ
jgi:hypothetical protein